MIRLIKARTADAIPRNFRGANRVRWNEELLTVQRENLRQGILSFDFRKKSARWKVVRDQLLRESFNKCAYCDTPTKAVAFGDVEHFRPKSKYWWLAYNYDNYL